MSELKRTRTWLSALLCPYVCTVHSRYACHTTPLTVAARCVCDFVEKNELKP